MSTILVTGGAVFIGGCLVRQLIDNSDDTVVNLDKLTYASDLSSLAYLGNNPRYTFIKGDICNRSVVWNIFSKYKPDMIIHLAAESHVDRSIDGPEQFIHSNIFGTFCLLEESIRYCREVSDFDSFIFLHVSTDEVYGSLEIGSDLKFTESSPYAPNSPYSASKAASDHLVRSYYETYDLPVIITHCSNNYGPYQYPEKLIPRIILQAEQNLPITVHGDGKNIRDWIHVADHCKALRRVARYGRTGEVYNIGANCERSNLEIITFIMKVMGVDRGLTFVRDRPGNDRRYAIDNSKVCKLGWEGETSFEEGLTETVLWYLSHREWLKSKWMLST